MRNRHYRHFVRLITARPLNSTGCIAVRNSHSLVWGLGVTMHDSLIVDVLVDYLETEGVEVIFGVHGSLPWFSEALRQRGTVRFALAGREGSAVFMANSYARVRNGLAVCCISSPCVTNAITGISCALRDSLPVLILSGPAFFTADLGSTISRDGHASHYVNAVNAVDIFRSITKSSAMLQTGDTVHKLFRGALHTATAGRRGPVHLNIPAELRHTPIKHTEADTDRTNETISIYDSQLLNMAIEAIDSAERPCILAGNGVGLANGEESLRALAEKIQAPVITTPKGKGTFSETHLLSLGVLGVEGQSPARTFLGQQDVLLIVGSSLNQLATSTMNARLQPTKTIIQIDIDPAAIGKNHRVDISLVGDAKVLLDTIAQRLIGVPTRSSVTEALQNMRRPSLYENLGVPEAQHLTVPRLLDEMRKIIPNDGMLFVDNEETFIWASRYFEVRQHGTYFIDSGSAVAGVVGGKLAMPGRVAVALVGDTAVSMHGIEVHTAVNLGLQVVWVILNNSDHGVVAINFAMIANAMGAVGIRVRTTSELRLALVDALQVQGPTVIDVTTDTFVAPH